MFSWLKKIPLAVFLQRKVALIVITGIGLLIMIIVIKSKPEMAHNNSKRPSVAVNYIEIKKHSLRPKIVGYGTVQPDLSLQAKAEVTGRVTYIHPKLKKGEIFAKDTLLLQIDDKDYLLQLKQSQADLLANEANLKEMGLKIENNELELKLSLEKLAVREKEYNRLQKLQKSGAVSQSKLDAEKQSLLQQKQELQKLKNEQTTLPSTLEVMKAQLEISKAKLRKSERDLERTQITIPFNGRVSQVYTEQDQYVQTGVQLFDASGLDKVMINAQFPMDQFGLFAKNFDPDKLNFENTEEIPSMSKVLESLRLTAEVHEVSGNFSSWSGKVERFNDNLDSKSRTVGVVVTVKDSYRRLDPGKKPPLLQGMYVKVSLHGAPLETLVIPRYALHEDQIYLISKSNQLKRITLTNLQYHGELVLLSAENQLDKQISEGDRLITSDVFPAVTGMELTPIIDERANQHMEQWLGAAQ